MSRASVQQTRKAEYRKEEEANFRANQKSLFVVLRPEATPSLMRRALVDPGLRIKFDHLGIFNVLRNPDTRAFLFKRRLPSPIAIPGCVENSPAGHAS